MLSGWLVSTCCRLGAHSCNLELSWRATPEPPSHVHRCSRRDATLGAPRAAFHRGRPRSLPAATLVMVLSPCYPTLKSRRRHTTRARKRPFSMYPTPNRAEEALRTAFLLAIGGLWTISFLKYGRASHQTGVRLILTGSVVVLRAAPDNSSQRFGKTPLSTSQGRLKKPLPFRAEQ